MNICALPPDCLCDVGRFLSRRDNFRLVAACKLLRDRLWECERFFQALLLEVEQFEAPSSFAEFDAAVEEAERFTVEARVLPGERWPRALIMDRELVWRRRYFCFLREFPAHTLPWRRRLGDRRVQPSPSLVLSIDEAKMLAVCDDLESWDRWAVGCEQLVCEEHSIFFLSANPFAWGVLQRCAAIGLRVALSGLAEKSVETADLEFLSSALVRCWLHFSRDNEFADLKVQSLSWVAELLRRPRVKYSAVAVVPAMVRKLLGCLVSSLPSADGLPVVLECGIVDLVARLVNGAYNGGDHLGPTAAELPDVAELVRSLANLLARPHPNQELFAEFAVSFSRAHAPLVPRLVGAALDIRSTRMLSDVGSAFMSLLQCPHVEPDVLCGMLRGCLKFVEKLPNAFLRRAARSTVKSQRLLRAVLEERPDLLHFAFGAVAEDLDVVTAARILYLLLDEFPGELRHLVTSAKLLSGLMSRRGFVIVGGRAADDPFVLAIARILVLPDVPESYLHVLLNGLTARLDALADHGQEPDDDQIVKPALDHLLQSQLISPATKEKVNQLILKYS